MTSTTATPTTTGTAQADRSDNPVSPRVKIERWYAARLPRPSDPPIQAQVGASSSEWLSRRSREQRVAEARLEVLLAIPSSVVANESASTPARPSYCAVNVGPRRAASRVDAASQLHTKLYIRRFRRGSLLPSVRSDRGHVSDSSSWSCLPAHPFLGVGLLLDVGLPQKVSQYP